MNKFLIREEEQGSTKEEISLLSTLFTLILASLGFFIGDLLGKRGWRRVAIAEGWEIDI